MAEKRGRGRPRTGSVSKHADPSVPGGFHYDARITFPGGKRGNPVCLEPGLSYERAREIAAAMTERAAVAPTPASAPPAPETPPAETFKAWATRWCDEREARGLHTVDDDRGRLRKWVYPLVGTKPIAGADRIATVDLEALVERLDEQVREGELSWKTASNVWGLVTKAFDDASNSKALALRVRARNDNPATDVRGPYRGTEKAKAWLYPRELLALASCPKIPAMWRRMYVVAAYLLLRAGELRALRWEDVDLDQGIVLVHCQEDDEGATRTTKGKRSRRFAIEPTLLPLLRAMHVKAGGKGHIFPNVPVEKHLAPMLRRHLKVARIVRADLFASDETRTQLRFHDLKASGVTWMALRGDDPHRIMHRAAHRSFSTTQGYIREAEAVRDGFGEVFPALPESLILSVFSPERVGANGHAYGTVSVFRSGRRDLNPRQRAPKARALPDCATPRRRGLSDALGGTLAEPRQRGNRDARAVPAWVHRRTRRRRRRRRKRGRCRPTRR